jgi:hypothetical protein
VHIELADIPGFPPLSMGELCVWPFSKRIIDVPAVSTKETSPLTVKGNRLSLFLLPRLLEGGNDV